MSLLTVQWDGVGEVNARLSSFSKGGTFKHTFKNFIFYSLNVYIFNLFYFPVIMELC